MKNNKNTDDFYGFFFKIMPPLQDAVGTVDCAKKGERERGRERERERVWKFLMRGGRGRELIHETARGSLERRRRGTKMER